MDHSNVYSCSNTSCPVIRERKLPLRAKMLSWLVEQALKCNKTREHRYQLSLAREPQQNSIQPMQRRMWNAHGTWGPSDPSWQGCGSSLSSLQQGSKVTLLPAFRGAAERWCVWLAGSWGHGAGGSNKVYYLDSTYQILVREVPHRV